MVKRTRVKILANWKNGRTNYHLAWQQQSVPFLGPMGPPCTWFIRYSRCACSLKFKWKGPPHARKKKFLGGQSFGTSMDRNIRRLYVNMSIYLTPSTDPFPLSGTLNFFSPSFSHVRINDLPVYPRHFPSVDQASLGRSYMAYCNY